MEAQSFVLTCGEGVEPLLADEMQQLGFHDVTQGLGAIQVQGDLQAAYRACLWSRLAARVLLPLLSTDEPSAEALYRAAFDFDWADFFAEGATFAVHAVAGRGVEQHTQYLALKLKDAIVDRCRQDTGQRPNVNPEAPDVLLYVFAADDGMDVSLDLSGGSLHRRGYRLGQQEAPLKENLAAALLLRAGWPDAAVELVVDPFCGSGTLLIEAAMMSADIAPGLLREAFGARGWRQHDEALWQGLLAEARERRAQGLAKPQPRFLGFDADLRAVSNAGRNAEKAGVGPLIHVERRELARFQVPAGKHGLLVTNPPYGTRLGDSDAAYWLYRALGRTLKTQCPGWRAAVLGGVIEHVDALRLPATDTFRCHNGGLTVWWRQVRVEAGEEAVPNLAPAAQVAMQHGDEALANRLRKNWKQFASWRAQTRPEAFRLYDADMPEYNVAVDIYPGEILVSEYAPPRQLPVKVAAERFTKALVTVRELFGLHREQVHAVPANFDVKRGRPRHSWSLVTEAGVCYPVDLAGRAQRDLPFWLRDWRQRWLADVRGQRVLEVDTRTGEAAVLAALAGVKRTDILCSHETSLAAIRRLFAINGLAESEHDLQLADIEHAEFRPGEQFDRIAWHLPPLRIGRDDTPTLLRQFRLLADRLSAGGTMYVLIAGRRQPPVFVDTRVRVTAHPEWLSRDMAQYERDYHLLEVVRL